MNELPITTEENEAFDALSKQVAGNHYKDLPIQPVQYIYANALGYFEGNVVKYVSRWRNKNGIADLEKAKHYIELLIELENRNADKRCNGVFDKGATK
jgi:hypothetical protein